MSFMVYGVAMMGYWAIGFAIQAGGVALTPVTADEVQRRALEHAVI